MQQGRGKYFWIRHVSQKRYFWKISLGDPPSHLHWDFFILVLLELGGIFSWTTLDLLCHNRIIDSRPWLNKVLSAFFSCWENLVWSAYYAQRNTSEALKSSFINLSINRCVYIACGGSECIFSTDQTKFSQHEKMQIEPCSTKVKYTAYLLANICFPPHFYQPLQPYFCNVFFSKFLSIKSCDCTREFCIFVNFFL